MNIQTVNIGEIIDDALRRLGEESDEFWQDFNGRFRIAKDEVLWYAWPQNWGDTTCGFGGIGLQAVTSAQTIVVEMTPLNEMFVYHAGRFAYNVPASDRFWDRVRRMRLPGALDTEAIEKLKLRVPID